MKGMIALLVVDALTFATAIFFCDSVRDEGLAIAIATGCAAVAALMFVVALIMR